MRLYWAPGTRSLRALWMLEEIGAPYERVLVDIRNGGQHTPEFHAVNPMEKVPALELDGACVAESGRHLRLSGRKVPGGRAGAADRGDTCAGATGNGCSFGVANIEAALTEKYANVQLPTTAAGWGSFDKVFAVLEEALAASPYILGEKFSAADVHDRLEPAFRHRRLQDAGAASGVHGLSGPLPLASRLFARPRNRRRRSLDWGLNAACSASKPACSESPGATGSTPPAPPGR